MNPFQNPLHVFMHASLDQWIRITNSVLTLNQWTAPVPTGSRTTACKSAQRYPLRYAWRFSKDGEPTCLIVASYLGDYRFVYVFSSKLRLFWWSLPILSELMNWILRRESRGFYDFGTGALSLKLNHGECRWMYWSEKTFISYNLFFLYRWQQQDIR